MEFESSAIWQSELSMKNKANNQFVEGKVIRILQKYADITTI